jgi:hypothetical protein
VKVEDEKKKFYKKNDNRGFDKIITNLRFYNKTAICVCVCVCVCVCGLVARKSAPHQNRRNGMRKDLELHSTLGKEKIEIR